MKSGKMTNVLLGLIFLALVANLLVPLLKTREAVAVGEDAVSPSVAAAEIAENLALDKVASQITGGLNQIAQSNRQIAEAIEQHARSNEGISLALERIAGKLSLPE